MDANEILAKNLKFYVIRSGKTQSQVAADIGVSKGTFSDWCSGRSHPRMDKIQRMAEYFSISKSELLESADPCLSCEFSVTARQVDGRPLLKKFLRLASTLDDGDLELAIKLAHRLGRK